MNIRNMAACVPAYVADVIRTERNAEESVIYRALTGIAMIGTVLVCAGAVVGLCKSQYLF